MVAVTAMMVSLGQTACGQSNCAAEGIAAPVISIIDAKTKLPICDARVLVTGVDVFEAGTGGPVESPSSGVVDAGIDGSSSLLVYGGGQACTYALSQFNPMGVCTLQVTHPGYATETVSNVYFATAACAMPASQHVVVLLYPTGS